MVSHRLVRSAIRSQNEATCRGHTTYSSAHQLLALVSDEESMAYRVVASTVDPRIIRSELETALGPIVENTGGRPSTAASPVDTLQGAIREARRVGHELVGTHHLLVGLAGPEAGPAAEVLARHGIDEANARRTMLAAVADDPDAGREPLADAQRYLRRPKRRKPRPWWTDIVLAGALVVFIGELLGRSGIPPGWAGRGALLAGLAALMALTMVPLLTRLIPGPVGARLSAVTRDPRFDNVVLGLMALSAGLVALDWLLR